MPVRYRTDERPKPGAHPTWKGSPMAPSASTTAEVDVQSDENRPLDDCDYYGCFFCSGPETD